MASHLLAFFVDVERHSAGWTLGEGLAWGTAGRSSSPGIGRDRPSSSSSVRGGALPFSEGVRHDVRVVSGRESGGGKKIAEKSETIAPRGFSGTFASLSFAHAVSWMTAAGAASVPFGEDGIVVVERKGTRLASSRRAHTMGSSVVAAVVSRFFSSFTCRGRMPIVIVVVASSVVGVNGGTAPPPASASSSSSPSSLSFTAASMAMSIPIV